jgi:1-acyl-sn-glycerol-3-phosphate acyltransferase
MVFLKSIIFIVLWFLWAFFLGIFIPFSLFKKFHQTIPKIGYIWARVTLYLLKVVCNISYEVTGIENIPNGPFIVASKHQSAWETIFFLFLFKNPTFILKKELTKIPIYGWYLKKMSMIIIDRKNGTNAIKQIKIGAENAIKHHRAVIIFPEGTRTLPGSRMQYKSGIKFLYDEFANEVPVIPIALNSGKYWTNKSLIKNPGVIKVKIMQPIILPSDSKFLTNLQNIIDTNSEEL